MSEENNQENIEEDVELSEQALPRINLEVPISPNHEDMVDSLRSSGMEDVEGQLANALQRSVEQQIHEIYQGIRYSR